MGFFKNIINGLRKTKERFSKQIDMLFMGTEIDDDFFEELEYVLIGSDISASTASQIIKELEQKVKKQNLKQKEEVKKALRETLIEMLNEVEAPEFDYPLALMVLGVNGVGKTTTLGKLANYFKQDKKDPVLIAADTFRAAASEQLNQWAKRTKVRIVKYQEGADPSAVVFDGVASAKAKGNKVALIDTAGRLHNKASLMEELKKISRTVEKNWEDVNYKKFIVLDATTGQNALNQVKYFDEAVGLDGIVLTKLDGTAKGGIVLSIIHDYNIPIYFIGVGEQVDDLRPFDAEEFIKAII